MNWPTRILVIGTMLVIGACSRSADRGTRSADGPRPSILLVTLDTTRADAIGPEATGVQTPAFNALPRAASSFARPTPRCLRRCPRTRRC